jgi:hypothetical protein
MLFNFLKMYWGEKNEEYNSRVSPNNLSSEKGILITGDLMSKAS